MSDDAAPPERRAGGPAGQPAAPTRPAVNPGALPSLPLRPRTERVSGANVGRWATFGCVAVMLVLVVLLMVGVNLTKRTVWTSFARAQQRLVEELPRDLPPGERLRTERNLERLRARIESTPDPLPMIGGFLGRVGEALDDGRLTAGEIADLNRFVEETLNGGGDQPR